MKSQVVELWDEYLSFVQRLLPKRAQTLLSEHKKKLRFIIAITVVQLIAYTAIGAYYFLWRKP